MSEIITKNLDLKKLRDEGGYSLEIKNGYLYVHNVPVLDATGKIINTFILSALELSGEQTLKPTQHVVYVGELPHQDINNSISTFTDIGLSQNQSVDGMNVCQLSRKPPNGYDDYYQKMTTYLNILAESVSKINNDASAKKFLNYPLSDYDDNLVHMDTNASRANISHLNKNFQNQKVAILGIGGTGSYVLDLISRLPLQQLALFDDDIYSNHNYFRSPGNRVPQPHDIKSVVFSEVYSTRHKNITAHEIKINESNLPILDNYNFIFICIDSMKDRKIITDYLNKKNFNI